MFQSMLAISYFSNTLIFKYVILFLIILNIQNASGGDCKIPVDRAHLITTRVPAEVKLLPGQIVATNSIVRYKCDPTYNLVGVNVSFCVTGGWNWDVPICTKHCNRKEVTQGFTTSVILTYENTVLWDNDPIPPGTIATFVCAFGYTSPTYTTLRCTDNATWDRKKPTCELNCGLVTPMITKFAKNGRNTSITEVPWHVGIYSNFKTNVLDQICGGTIISAKLVISAAHCFWDAANENIFDASYYKVGAGKYFLDYESANEPFDVQKMSIKNIYVEMYNDLTENYRNDLAVLVLKKHLTFTHSVKPVCMEFFNCEYRKVNSGTVGLFAGWGVTNDNNPSTVLQTVTMTTLSHSDCTNTLKDKQNSYELPDDKFCLYDKNGGTACRGDSGGGFVIKRSTQRFLGSSRYFLIGIVSHAPMKEQDCARDTIVAFTSIQYFKMLIEKNMAEQKDVEDDEDEDTANSVSTFQVSGAGCKIPDDREHLIITNVQSLAKLRPGEIAAVNSIVSYTCDPTYNLVGVNGSFCRPEGWYVDVPICTKYCSRQEITQGHSTTVTITYQNRELGENDSILPETIATFKCVEGYVSLQYKILRCTDKGVWDLRKPNCTSDCGSVSPNITAIARDGRNISITDVPWHVGIYSNFKSDQFDHICDGTIIAVNLVLSAAHCFWDKANRTILDASYFRVGAGKYFRNYESTEEPFEVQKMSIQTIFVQRYKDVEENYRNDIAFLLLEKYLTYTHSIQSIGMTFPKPENFYARIPVFFASWGNNATTMLQTVTTPLRSHSDCMNTLKDKQSAYNLTDDKFCMSGGNACSGDRGGGVAMKRDLVGRCEHYLIGIISHQQVKKQDCGKDTVVALTNILHFQDFIIRSVAIYQRRRDEEIHSDDMDYEYE